MSDETPIGRRTALRLGLLAAAVGGGAEKAARPADPRAVTPNEDLMREHGLLQRLLLIYDEVGRRASAGQDVPADRLAAAARLVSKLIEGYHEKLEEDYVFPRLRRVGHLTELAEALKRQHAAGRLVTTRVREIAERGVGQERSELVELLNVYQQMYRPHSGREDTVLFPAFKGVVPGPDYRELGEKFEEEEQALLGEGGFQEAVRQVAQIERALGIHDITRFTPQPE